MEASGLSNIVANNIRAEAERKGLSLNTLADLAGVSRSQLFNLLAGDHDVTLGWLAKVAAALEVEPAQLLVTKDA